MRAAVRSSGSAAVRAAARVSSRASVKAILRRSPLTPLVRAVASRLAFALVRATCNKWVSTAGKLTRLKVRVVNDEGVLR